MNKKFTNELTEELIKEGMTSGFASVFGNIYHIAHKEAYSEILKWIEKDYDMKDKIKPKDDNHAHALGRELYTLRKIINNLKEKIKK